MTHLLGGIQLDAPPSSGGGHCVDQFDVMCYSDAPYYPAMQQLCPADQAERLDCNHDDYYHTNPPAGSYLATHWNVANSEFLNQAAEAANPPLAISIAVPTNDGLFVGSATITITAQVSDSESILTKIEFFDDQTLLGTATTLPTNIAGRASPAELMRSRPKPTITWVLL